MSHTAAPAEVTDLINDVMEERHPELIEAGVTVITQMHFSEKGLRLHGVPCHAIIKLTSEKDRSAPLCMQDARLTINLPTWETASDATKRSRIDHELLHLMVRRDKMTGEILEDDASRPKLKMKPHDYEVGWFAEIAERHGEASDEVQQAKMLTDSTGQLIWPWSGTSREEDSDTADIAADADADSQSRRRSISLTRNGTTTTLSVGAGA